MISNLQPANLQPANLRPAKQGAAAFLHQAHRNNWHQYLASLRPDAQAGWDLCLLTASDERQAEMYRRQLDWRRQTGSLPAKTRFFVLPDPGGQRVGSGGATLRALRHIKSEGADTQRVLIIHSGGDSRRLPHCSAIGKLFARVPRVLPDGRASTIFDEFLISLSALATVSPPGVLVASGDVLLVFDHLQLSFLQGGVVGVAAAAPAQMGSRHGVYVSVENERQVKAFLHKSSEEILHRWHAVAPDGTVQIDTGLVWFDTGTAGKFAGLAGEKTVLRPRLNLYGDLLAPLALSTTFDDYLADRSDGAATAKLQAARRLIWNRLRGTNFGVERLQPAVFLHFGSSREYWEMAAGDPELASLSGWSSQAAAWMAGPKTGQGSKPVLVNAALAGSVQTAGPAALILDSRLQGSLLTHGAAIVSGVQTALSLALEVDVVLDQLPLGDGQYVTRTFGLFDNPKQVWTDPGATFMNRPWADWLAETRLAPDLLWPDMTPEEQTLWTARLYPVIADREASLALSLPLQDPSRINQDWRARWSSAQRVSLAESFLLADGEQLLYELAALEDDVAVHRYGAALESELPAIEMHDLFGRNPETARRRVKLAARWLAQADPIVRLRGYKALAVVTGEDAWEDRAFVTLANLVRTDLAFSPAPSIQGVGQVRVYAAARIDFGGGWTDTLPYSIERGGTVLNAAVQLRGVYPILAEAATLAEPQIVLESRDLGARLAPATVGELLAYDNPAAPFSLHKAALVLRGIVPANSDPNTPIAEICRSLGGGLRLCTETSIPRGSGLGTSSILAGALLMSLTKLLGEDADD